MKQIEGAAAVIRRGNEFFATQRGYGEFKDWWEFPGGDSVGNAHEKAVSVSAFVCTQQGAMPKIPSYLPTTLPNTRIDVADILRGIAIGGIVLIHFIEHLNFYCFPEASSPFWATVNQAVWDTTFYLLAGKMYAIFALLFGLSFFIQHDNAARRGIDFRPRFAWRMLLMMLWGLFDLFFYNGDILFVYAVCGLMVLPFIRCSNKIILIAAAFLAIQPIELYCIITGLINPALPAFNLGSGAHWAALFEACANGSLLDVGKAGIVHGLPVNFLWAAENGRLTQNIFLFLLGIYFGRKRLFYNEGSNLIVWKRILIAAACSLAVLIPLYELLPGSTGITRVDSALDVLLNMWKNFAMMLVIVSGIVLLFYCTKAHNGLLKLAPYGKMSLTNYLGQSIFGAMLFYGWGFGLYQYCGHTASWLMGAAFICLQYIFCRNWLKTHKRGPCEELWSRATWIGAKK